VQSLTTGRVPLQLRRSNRGQRLAVQLDAIVLDNSIFRFRPSSQSGCRLLGKTLAANQPHHRWMYRCDCHFAGDFGEHNGDHVQ
jgi:hypothetical protein